MAFAAVAKILAFSPLLVLMHADVRRDLPLSRELEAIVLAKRLNKGRQLSAEVVEGRASPKGNSR
jgi:hypothetical protein